MTGNLFVLISSPPQPKLIINKAAIYETDSVTLNCMAPSSVSQCYYKFGETVRILSCLHTLTGSDLLLMSHQSSPAVIKVTCFYTEKLGDIKSPSPYSDPSSIAINIPGKPELSLHHSPGDSVIFTCSLPGSAHHDTTCNLYLGEARHPVETTKVKSKTNSKKQSFCQFFLTVDDLLRWLCSVQQKDASCDHTLGSGPNYLSPRSDGYSLKDFLEEETRMTSTLPACTVTTELNVDGSVTSTPVTTTKHTSAPTIGTTSNIISTLGTSVTPTSGLPADSQIVADVPVSTSLTPAQKTPGLPTDSPPVAVASVSTSLTPAQTTPDRPPPVSTTPAQPTPETWKWVVTSLGVAVGVIVLGVALLCTKRRTERCLNKRGQENVTEDSMYMGNSDHRGLSSAVSDQAYCMITSVPNAVCLTAGPEKLNKEEPQNRDSAVYHVYSTIPEDRPPSTLKDMVYSTLQAY
ncbi:uncharacterized protein LOC121507153 isoform X2 [Cheilinus undulatus]|uniref:uncharacterized protein LOC121507153 isoform X2 n=1 Tax=Cheilinus undulatus TaxID=241271 RepID=UPI001BD5D883|nr:uncharacterized protein LOC121507153 isoform X2 [Cheilinus undulatus]